MFNKKQNIIIHIYELDNYTNHRFDFLIKNSSVESVFYDPLILDFNTIQIVQEESIDTIRNRDFFIREQYTQIAVDAIPGKSDLIITSYLSKHLFPYSFGNYLYLIFSDNIKPDSQTIHNWFVSCCPNRFKDIDNLYAGQINRQFKFIEGLEFVVITNYDSNRDIGIVLINNRLEKVLNWINQISQNENISDVSYESYDDSERENIL